MEIETKNTRFYTYHREKDEICKEIANKLKTYGIQVDTENGQIYYDRCCVLRLECHVLYLLRHGETYGTQSKEFMSDTSANAKLTYYGIDKLKKTAEQLRMMDFDVIFYSSISRVKETFEVVYGQIGGATYCEEISWMVGIDNAGWEQKNKEELTGIDAEDFYQREIKHNIFAKSSRGCCWGEVLCRCIKLIEYINQSCQGKRVLLISQGSIARGLRIVLHMEKEPWDKYDSEALFSLKSAENHDYGILQLICGT